ncbi:class I SAM-dependent methyltransferase [Candidatus Roizmanbacteria bacterium]|nr:class I SAM-dependent methyltransferase [Candidatus Roizmanbacteria bacterium]
MRVSSLARRPKSKIREKGYINIYSKLTPQEKRQIFYNRRYKKLNPSWDNSLILLCKTFSFALDHLAGSKKSVIVLDVGCGHGNYVIDEFRSKITWAAGIDLEKKFTRKNVCLDEIKQASAEKIPYQNEAFDIVLSLWVLEHLKNPDIVIREIQRVLKRGGFFIFATPNKNSITLFARRLIKSEKIVFFANKLLYGRNEKDIFFTYYKANTIGSLKKLLGEAGFEEIKSTLNYDPGYTSFNELTFNISNMLNSLFEKIAPHYYKHHILGLARK